MRACLLWLPAAAAACALRAVRLCGRGRVQLLCSQKLRAAPAGAIKFAFLLEKASRWQAGTQDR
jgi:hypothetical protein